VIDIQTYALIGYMKVRIQKYLSQKGILSRRKTEEYIKKGWISVNGKIVEELGFGIEPTKDKIEFSEEIDNIRENYIYLALNKPKGIITNCAEPGEKEIRDILPEKYKHLSSIGRLDKESEGLILLTDDGIFAKSILNTDDPHEREYEVQINAPITEEMISELEQGLYILGKKTLPARITLLGSKTFRIVLREGRNRQIRKMLRAVSREVVRLKRIRFGNIKLNDLRPGYYFILNKTDLKSFSHF
jgi:23S rRNA pseudouridine2605 synthase